MPPLQAALPAPCYIDDAHWRRERERVLHREWFCAARLSTHGLDQGLTDPPAPCPASALRCPYHSWTYDLCGRLLKAPHTEDVEAFAPDAFGLHPVGAATWGGFLFLHVTPDAAPPLLAPTFGRMLADLVTQGSTGSDISGFAIDRPALVDAGFPLRWLA
jgi:Rieske 2Fe-2S family protein